MTIDEVNRDRVPAACTLPMAQVPRRMAEFEDLFAVVRTAERPASTAAATCRR